MKETLLEKNPSQEDENINNKEKESELLEIIKKIDYLKNEITAAQSIGSKSDISENRKTKIEERISLQNKNLKQLEFERDLLENNEMSQIKLSKNEFGTMEKLAKKSGRATKVDKGESFEGSVSVYGNTEKIIQQNTQIALSNDLRSIKTSGIKKILKSKDGSFLLETATSYYRLTLSGESNEINEEKIASNEGAIVPVEDMSGKIKKEIKTSSNQKSPTENNQKQINATKSDKEVLEEEMATTNEEEYIKDVETFETETSATPENKNEKEAVEQIKNMNPKEQKTFLEGIANIGYGTTQLKSKALGGFCRMLSAATKKSNVASAFFNQYASIYDRMGKRAKKDRETVGKDNLKKGMGMGQGIGNVLQYGRAMSDFNYANPFRHVTAASMFVGRASEAVKETRLDYDSVKEKTRVEDENRAWDEAYELYKKIKDEKGEVSAEDLNRAYKENLPEDIIKRLERANFSGTKFYERTLDKTAQKEAKWIVNHIEKIKSDGRLTPKEKEIKIQNYLYRKESQLKDLDRIVSDQAGVDTISYVSRATEKTGKGVATVMMVDTAYRAIKHAPELISALGNMFDNNTEVATAPEAETAKGNTEPTVVHETITVNNEKMFDLMENISNEDFTEARERLVSTLAVDESKIKLVDDSTIKIEGLDGQFEVTKDENILWRNNNDWMLLKKDGSFENVAGQQNLAKEVEVKEDTPLTEEVTAEAKEIKPKIISTVEIKGKINTLSEAIEQNLKQDGVPDETKDAFISQWTKDGDSITDENRNDLLNKAIKNLSIANLKIGDEKDIQNLIFKGNVVQLNSDGTIKVLKGSGDSEAKIVSEEQLEANSDTVRVEEEARIKTEEEERIRVEEEARIKTEEEAKTRAEEKNAIIAEAEVATEKKAEDIYKYKWGFFKGDQQEEWDVMKNKSAQDIMNGNFGEHIGKSLDQVEINNREQLQNYLSEAGGKIGSPGENETVKDYLQKYEEWAVEHANNMEADLLETGNDKDIEGLRGIPDNEKKRIFNEYENVIYGLETPEEKINLLKVLYNPGDKESVSKLIGKMDNNVFQGEPSAKINKAGNLVVSFNVKDNVVDVDLIISKNGKIAADGYSYNNWPDGVDVNKPTKPFNKHNLESVKNWFNNGGFKGEVKEIINPGIINPNDISLIIESPETNTGSTDNEAIIEDAPLEEENRVIVEDAPREEITITQEWNEDLVESNYNTIKDKNFDAKNLLNYMQGKNRGEDVLKYGDEIILKTEDGEDIKLTHSQELRSAVDKILLEKLNNHKKSE